MGSGGVAIAALPTVICFKVTFSDGLGGGDEGSDGTAAWDFNQKLHQYKLKE